MSNSLDFDVALSYSSSDAWIAKDLADLIKRYGYSIYCFDSQPDHARGFLRTNLRDIYRKSRLNIIIWSESYEKKEKDTIVDTELRLIIHRHIEKDDAKALFVLSVDDTPVSKDMEEILIHNLKETGITGAEKHVLSRLKDLAIQKSGGVVIHPTGTEHDRGQLHPCSFYINKGFKADKLKRWQRLADVEVKFRGTPPLNTQHVYLIPSGRVMNLIGHTLILQSDEEILERKRITTIEFIQQNQDKEIKGYWFAMKKNQAEIATVYSEAYDKFLNDNF